MHTINLDALSQAMDFPAVVRWAAIKLMKTPYLDVGTFLKELSKPDLDELARYVAAVTAKIDVPPMLESLVILGEVLAQAEGIPLEHPDVHRTSNLMILITFEDLARKGVINFDRSKATLGGDITEIADLASMK